MVPLKAVSVLALLALLAWVPAAMADVETYTFECITDNSATDCDLAEAQLALEVDCDDTLDVVTFKILNNDPPGEQMTIEQFFIQDLDDLLDLDSAALTEPVGVDFTIDASPGNLPGGNTISFVTEKSGSAEPPAPQNGINPGEWLEVTFDLASSSVTCDDLFQSIADDDLMMGIHVINFESGGSESLVNDGNGNPIPLPMAAWSGLALFGGLTIGRLRRRQHE